MVKRIKTIQIKKDKWDYIYEFIMLFFTGLTAIGTFVLIPTQIRESNLNFRNYSDVNPNSIGPRIPYLIYGQFSLKGVAMEGANITIINSYTGEQISTSTDSNGLFEMNLEEFPHYFQFGDILVITACVKKLCEKKEIILSGKEPGLEINFQTS